MSVQDINDWIAAQKFPDLPPPEYQMELSREIAVGDRKYTSILLREPRTSQYRRASEWLKNGATATAVVQRNIQLIADCAEVPPAVVELMGISDVSRAMTYLAAFLDYGPRTGET